jgi:hypothetical protein
MWIYAWAEMYEKGQDLMPEMKSERYFRNT